MNFILFNIVLLFVGFLAVLIFSIGLMACFAPMALFAKAKSPPKVVMLPLLGIGRKVGGQIFILDNAGLMPGLHFWQRDGPGGR